MILVILVLWAFFSGQCCYLCSHYFSTPFVAPQLWGLSLEVLRFLELKVNSSASSQLQLVAGGSLCSSHDPCLVSTFQSQIDLSDSSWCFFPLMSTMVPCTYIMSAQRVVEYIKWKNEVWGAATYSKLGLVWDLVYPYIYFLHWEFSADAVPCFLNISGCLLVLRMSQGWQYTKL